MRAAAAIRRHRALHVATIATHPHNQPASSMRGKTAATTVAEGATIGAGRENGWPIASQESMTTANGGAATAPDRPPTCAPNATSAAKGTRNFTDAASHSAYRTCGRLRRSARASSATTAATTVDCQR